MWKKIILSLLVLGVLGGVYGYFFMYNKSHPDYEDLDVEVTISAEDIFQQCRADGKAADFTGKMIELTGTPQEIETNDGLITMVFVFEEGMFGAEGVRATFLSKYNEEVEALIMNTEVRLKAYCTGYNETDVVLEKASLINANQE